MSRRSRGVRGVFHGNEGNPFFPGQGKLSLDLLPLVEAMDEVGRPFFYTGHAFQGFERRFQYPSGSPEGGKKVLGPDTSQAFYELQGQPVFEVVSSIGATTIIHT